MAASASGVAAAAALGPAEGPCVLCCGELEVVALGRCDHPICYRCSVRMRALCGVRYCAVCREELGQVRPRRGRGGGERGQARGEASAGPCGTTPRSSRSAAGGGREGTKGGRGGGGRSVGLRCAGVNAAVPLRPVLLLGFGRPACRREPRSARRHAAGMGPRVCCGVGVGETSLGDGSKNGSAWSDAGNNECRERRRAAAALGERSQRGGAGDEVKAVPRGGGSSRPSDKSCVFTLAASRVAQMAAGTEDP